MKTTVKKTGIFQTTSRTPENQSEKEEHAMAFLGAFDAEKRLDEIDATLARIVEPYLLRTHPNASHLFGNVATDAEPIVIRARDARVLVKQVRDAVESNSTKLAVVFALDLGWALCHMGAEQFEPDVLKAQRSAEGSKAGARSTQTKGAINREYTRNAALAVWKKHPDWDLAAVRKHLNHDTAVRTQFPQLPKPRTIRDHTEGLEKPSKKTRSSK